MTKTNETMDQQNRGIEDQSPILEEHTDALELRLDELCYVSGGFFIIRPIKPWYCGQE